MHVRVFILFLLFQQQTLSKSVPAISQEQAALLAQEKTKYFMDKVTQFANESSSLLCIECFKRDITRMLTCLSQPPLPDRVDFIRLRCPIPVNLYSKIINKYVQMKL